MLNFFSLLYDISNGCETGHIQKHLDKWQKGIPDTPKIYDYGEAVEAETNSITKQKENIWWPYLWGSHVSTGDKILNNNNCFCKKALYSRGDK